MQIFYIFHRSLPPLPFSVSHWFSFLYSSSSPHHASSAGATLTLVATSKTTVFVKNTVNDTASQSLLLGHMLPPGVQISSSFSGFSSWISSITSSMVCYLQVPENKGETWTSFVILGKLPVLPKLHHRLVLVPTQLSKDPTAMYWDSGILQQREPKQRLHINFTVVLFRNNIVAVSKKNMYTWNSRTRERGDRRIAVCLRVTWSM